MFTMDPPPWSRMMGAVSWLVRRGPSTFTANTFLQYSSVIVEGLKRPGLIPALLTNTSIRPHRSTTLSMKEGISSHWPTWQAIPTAAEPVADVTSAATVSQSSCFLLLTTTVAPAPASPSAIARPMPFVEPVTIATRPLRSNSSSW